MYKTPHMGWTYSNDPMSELDTEYDDLDIAISKCKFLGVDYVIEYPKP